MPVNHTIYLDKYLFPKEGTKGSTEKCALTKLSKTSTM